MHYYHNQLTDFLNSIEKIGKVLVNKIKQGDTISVAENLEWFEINFSRLIELRKSNLEKFRHFVDPENQYIKQPRFSFENIDWTKISIEIKPPREELPIDRFQKLYTHNDRDKNRSAFQKYLKTIEEINKTATDNKKNELSRKCQLVLGNMLNMLLSIDDDVVDFEQIIRKYLSCLEQIFFDSLKTTKPFPVFVYYAGYSIHLDNIFNLNTKNYLPILFDSLLTNIIRSINLGEGDVFKKFISQCIDGPYSHLSNHYVFEELRKLNTNDIAHVSKSTEYYRKLKIIDSDDDLNKWMIDIQTFIGNDTSTVIQRFEDAAFEQLKYNLLKRTVVKSLVYIIYKNKYDFLEFAIFYNQPLDSNATHTNKDIIPSSNIEIIELLENVFSIENELYSFWENHHGVSKYIEELIIILICRNWYQSKRGVHSYEQVNLFDQQSFEELDGLKQQLERLKKILNYKSTNQNCLTIFITNKNVSKEEINTIIDNWVSAIETKITVNIVKAEIDKIAPIKRIIDAYLKSGNKVADLIKNKQSEAATKSITEEYFPIVGLSKIRDKTTFIKNWHIASYGFYEASSQEMVFQENNILLSEYARNIQPENKLEISEFDLPIKLDQLNLSNKIIIGHNVYFDSAFRNSEHYVPKWELESSEQESKPASFIGYYKKTPVYSINDRSFNRVFVLDSNILGEIEPRLWSQIANFDNDQECYYKIIVFSDTNDQKELTNFLNDPPEWLIEIPEEERMDYLKQKVWIRIYKTFKLVLPKDFNGYLFMINDLR